MTDRGRPYTDTPFVIPPGVLKSPQQIGDDPNLRMALNLTHNCVRYWYTVCICYLQCVCIHIYIYMYICTHVYTCVNIYIYILYVHTYTYTWIGLQKNWCMQSWHGARCWVGGLMAGFAERPLSKGYPSNVGVSENGGRKNHEKSTKSCPFLVPIGSMYAIYGNIYYQYTPFMLALIYQHHGSYGV